MKNDSLQQDIQRQVHLAKCSKGNQAVMICSNQKCTNNAFVCDDKKCPCRLPHKLCPQLSIQKIQHIILSHSCEIKPFQDKIQDIFNKAIDKLSDQRDSILSQMKLKSRKLGLTEIQNKFLTVLTQGDKNNQVNCQFVWKLLSEMDREEEKNGDRLGYFEQNLSKLEKQLTEQIYEFNNRLKSLFEVINKAGCWYFATSKIVTKIEDQNKIRAFFTQKPIKSTQLLYRASQNDFLASKFYQKCSKITNTVTIVETEHGKIIGGFSSIPWNKPSTGGQYVYVASEDNKYENFLFSVTSDEKLSFKKEGWRQYCICLCDNSTWGPKFGGGHDLAISNKANQNNASYASSHSYTQPKSVGGLAGQNNFKIKEWEVWEVSFDG